MLPLSSRTGAYKAPSGSSQIPFQSLLLPFTLDRPDNRQLARGAARPARLLAHQQVGRSSTSSQRANTPAQAYTTMSSSSCSPAVLATLLLLCSTICCVRADWREGRATFYGNEPWYWSIHHGSCGFGYLWPDQNTGWDIAALADTHPDYAGSCGDCYEVRCKGTTIKDGYGQTISRGGACKDEGASVVLRTTDTCPCQFSNNYYSNKRWCCGDMDHMDISVWAFQKLTDMEWGVIPIEYRKADCGYQPSNKASGAGFPGEFPPESEASSRPDFDWYKYFPNGGYLNSHAGDGSGMVSTDEYLHRVGRGGSSSYSSAQFGKK